MPSQPPNPKIRKIAAGPIYDLTVVQSIIKAAHQTNEQATWIATESAENSLNNDFPSPWDYREVEELILALTASDYMASEWAKTSANMSVDCDAYEIPYNRNRKSRWPLGSKIYVKFGMSRFRPLCIVISLHPSVNKVRK